MTQSDEGASTLATQTQTGFGHDLFQSQPPSTFLNAMAEADGTSVPFKAGPEVPHQDYTFFDGRDGMDRL